MFLSGQAGQASLWCTCARCNDKDTGMQCTYNVNVLYHPRRVVNADRDCVVQFGVCAKVRLARRVFAQCMCTAKMLASLAVQARS